MSNSSPARRIRTGSIRLGLMVSAIAFMFIEGYALQDQLTIGQASLMFMLGTALLSAGVCIGLFALITAIGLAASVFFSEQKREQREEIRQHRADRLQQQSTHLLPNQTRYDKATSLCL